MSCVRLNAASVTPINLQGLGIGRPHQVHDVYGAQKQPECSHGPLKYLWLPPTMRFCIDLWAVSSTSRSSKFAVMKPHISRLVDEFRWAADPSSLSLWAIGLI